MAKARAKKIELQKIERKESEEIKLKKQEDKDAKLATAIAKQMNKLNIPQPNDNIDVTYTEKELKQIVKKELRKIAKEKETKDKLNQIESVTLKAVQNLQEKTEQNASDIQQIKIGKINAYRILSKR